MTMKLIDWFLFSVAVVLVLSLMSSCAPQKRLMQNCEKLADDRWVCEET